MLRTRQPLIRRARIPPEGLGLFCNYSHRVCMQKRLDGFEFCLKHILEDKTSPYKQCSFISTKTNRRCGNAAPRADRREGYCLEHSRKSCILRQQASRKRRPKESAESLLAELNHYNPTKDSLDVHKSRLIGESLASKILDYGSSSDSSDGELPLVEQAWRGDGESDAESIDSEQEDPLKHAGIYTAEEVTLIMKDKLIRLQSLYIEQFKRLQHILKEKRRKYLHTTKVDRDTHGPPIPKGDLEAQKKLAKLAALKRYHQRHGKEALLQRQSKERRVAVSEGLSHKPPVIPKCTHSAAGSRCPVPALPLTKFCAQHVVDDPHQVLFQSCAFAQGECGKPVTVFTTPLLCDVHFPLAEPIPHTSMNDSEEQTTRDTELLSAENSLETSARSELSAVDDTGLQLLAAQSSIMSAVTIPSDALSASSDTLSAPLDEQYISSDVPSASSDATPSLADVNPPSAALSGVADDLTSHSDPSSDMPADFPPQSGDEPAPLEFSAELVPIPVDPGPSPAAPAPDDSTACGPSPSPMDTSVTLHATTSLTEEKVSFLKPLPRCPGDETTSSNVGSTLGLTDADHPQPNFSGLPHLSASAQEIQHSEKHKTGTGTS